LIMRRRSHMKSLIVPGPLDKRQGIARMALLTMGIGVP
jgi:hypothetical protein